MPGEKATDQSKILDLRSQNSLLQHDMCPNFFNQKSLHPNVYLALGIHILEHFLNFVLRYGSSRSSIDILESWKRIIYIIGYISSSFELFSIHVFFQNVIHSVKRKTKRLILLKILNRKVALHYQTPQSLKPQAVMTTFWN